ncbi:hypothetical protein [Bordetella bronchialis]|uniref:hypothetical protein n=1 Tax=Bordetella bronchialis TaxID=463025 RepID=UPI0012EAC4A1|nr:hypothetical protein [Bordetella bronchialis]
MNGIQLQTQVTALREMLSRLEAIHVSCKTCQHFRNTYCERFEDVPPADVAVVGCEEWEFDGVPF